MLSFPPRATPSGSASLYIKIKTGLNLPPGSVISTTLLICDNDIKSKCLYDFDWLLNVPDKLVTPGLFRELAPLVFFLHI